tara:strand:+ start:531 stop:977 length:447 start_codon:yes stop_codon:yes gene_type:complete
VRDGVRGDDAADVPGLSGQAVDGRDGGLGVFEGALDVAAESLVLDAGDEERGGEGGGDGGDGDVADDGADEGGALGRGLGGFALEEEFADLESSRLESSFFLTGLAEDAACWALRLSAISCLARSAAALRSAAVRSTTTEDCCSAAAL